MLLVSALWLCVCMCMQILTFTLLKLCFMRLIASFSLGCLIFSAFKLNLFSPGCVCVFNLCVLAHECINQR